MQSIIYALRIPRHCHPDGEFVTSTQQQKHQGWLQDADASLLSKNLSPFLSHNAIIAYPLLPKQVPRFCQPSLLPQAAKSAPLVTSSRPITSHPSTARAPRDILQSTALFPSPPLCFLVLPSPASPILTGQRTGPFSTVHCLLKRSLHPISSRPLPICAI